MKTPITRERLKTHFTYNAWKYIVVCACAVVAWSLIYTQTAYRSPQNKRVDLYLKSSTVTEELAEAFVKPIWESTVPDMELVNTVLLMASAEEDYYSQMQLSVYIIAGEGDIYILPAADYKSFASSGAFMELEGMVADGTLQMDGIDLSSGYVTVRDEEAGTVETHLYGIPLDSLYGYMDGLQMDNRGMVAAILYNNQNDANVIPFFNAFVNAGRGEKPEWLVERTAE